ncbi:hypothetical protein [Micromonospora zamorensis]|uniref:hypothetical protein n=1 Tax=Micromonospora zamorensis TaxID=709883 RepID=UPI0033AEBC11
MRTRPIRTWLTRTWLTRTRPRTTGAWLGTVGDGPDRTHLLTKLLEYAVGAPRRRPDLSGS